MRHIGRMMSVYKIMTCDLCSSKRASERAKLDKRANRGYFTFILGFILICSSTFIERQLSDLQILIAPLFFVGVGLVIFGIITILWGFLTSPDS